MYIKITNDGINSYSIRQLKIDNPSVSFPQKINNELLEFYNVFPVTRTDRPQYDPITQNMTEGTPALIEGVWTQVWNVTDATTEEIEQRIADLASSVRSTRNKLLAETDWRFRSDMTPSQAWIDYCQALRDITDQEGFPYSVVWPTRPE